ncbi:MAG: amidohydrolase [Polyangiaceae bacterium]|nr:amidohydrolase [Polyangiaceae bacterium]
MSTDLVEIRRSLHRIPELAFEEEQTAQRILDALRALGVPATHGGRGTGVIARIRGRDPSAPVVALRAEMDALPGDEATGLPFASEHRGRVHSCGHDAHMAMLLGAARVLLQAGGPDGDVVLLFQPAEERGAGSRTMIRAGALAGVDAIFAGHVTHHYATGQIMVADGAVTAQSDRFLLRVQGKGGHGARPHEAVDAVIVAGFLITALQTLVSREIDPLHPTVITIGRVQAGTAANVIAAEALLEGSIRTTQADTRVSVHRGIRRMAEAAGMLHNARVTVEIAEGSPPVVNTTREAEIARRAAESIVGTRSVVPQEYPSMGSEDFAFYLREVPGCYVRFGACKEGWTYVPLHSPGFTVDEDVLEVGASFFAEVVREAQRTLPRRP